MRHASNHWLNYRSYLKKFISFDDTPRRLALSFAIGIFISISPFFGLHSAAAIAVSAIFKLNMPAILIGSWMNNPLTVPFVFWICYYIGKLFLGGEPLSWNMPWHKLVITHAGPVFLNIVVGWLIFGSVVAVTSFVIMKTWIERRRIRSISHDPRAKS